MISENCVLGRIFVPKRDEVMGGWRKLHNELHSLYPSPNVFRMIKKKRGGMHVAYIGGT
jgi:hypothetical protein